MTSSAKSYFDKRFGAKYRNVALVKLTAEATAIYLETGRLPRMISRRARGVEDVKPYTQHRVGKTGDSAYAKALVEAQSICDQLNQNQEEVDTNQGK